MEVKYSFFEHNQNKLYHGIAGEVFPVLSFDGWLQTSYILEHLYQYLVQNGCNLRTPDLSRRGKPSYPKSYYK